MRTLLFVMLCRKLEMSAYKWDGSPCADTAKQLASTQVWIYPRGPYLYKKETVPNRGGLFLIGEALSADYSVR